MLIHIGQQQIDTDDYRRRMDIIDETARQVVKDFGLHGFEIVFSGNPETAYNELYNQVYKVVEQLYSDNSRTLYNLFYTVDITLDKVKHLLALPDQPLQHLTNEILQRELKKVVIRDYFRRNS